MLEEFEAKRRPEDDLKGSWGLYQLRDGSWLDVVFRSQGEAIEALAVLKASLKVRPLRRSKLLDKL